MELIHTFYKELNGVEEFKFKKSKEYAVTGLSINQDIDSR